MPCCAAFNCKSGRSKEFPAQMFKFPSGHRRLRTWLEKMRVKNWKPSESSRLCIKHFHERHLVPVHEDLDATGMPKKKRSLKPHAFPTIFEFKRKKKIRKPPSKRDSRIRRKSYLRPVVVDESSLVELDHCYADVRHQTTHDATFTIVDTVVSVESQNGKIDHHDSKNENSVETETYSETNQEETVSKTHQAIINKKNPSVIKELVELSALKKSLMENEALKLALARSEAEKRALLNNETLKGVMKENEDLRSALKKVFHEDQIRVLVEDIARPKKWTNFTLNRSIQIRHVIGAAGYEMLREMGQPLPSQSTLNNFHKGDNFEAGILEEILQFI